MHTIDHCAIEEQLAQFGRNVRTARETAGLSQDDIDFDRATISIIERAKRTPDLPTVVHLAHAVYVTPARLLRGLGDTTSDIRGPRYQPDPAVSPASYFGANLRWARYATGISQEALAAEAGVDRAAVSTFEHGLRDPNLRTIIKLACALHVRASILLNGIAATKTPLKSSRTQLAQRGAQRPPTPSTRLRGQRKASTS